MLLLMKFGNIDMQNNDQMKFEGLNTLKIGENKNKAIKLSAKKLKKNNIFVSTKAVKPKINSHRVID